MFRFHVFGMMVVVSGHERVCPGCGKIVRNQIRKGFVSDYLCGQCRRGFHGFILPIGRIGWRRV